MAEDFVLEKQMPSFTAIYLSVGTGDGLLGEHLRYFRWWLDIELIPQYLRKVE